MAPGYVFVSYAGLLKIASVAEEVRSPSRNIPLGMMLALGVVSAFYTAVVGVTVGALAPETLAGSLTPISDGAEVFMGRGGRIALSVAAVLAFLTTANAGIMTSARSLLPLSRDRLFPESFAGINRRFGTPHNALLLTGAVILLSLFLKLDILVEAASIVLIITNVLSCLSVVVLRESGLQNYRPRFRSPLYPWMQVGGIIAFAFVLLEMGVEAFTITVLLLLAGFCAYWFYGRKRVRQESALLHLVERITDRKLVTGTLEAELKQVFRERDNIAEDRFDHLVERCAVLDLDRPTDLGTFFSRAAEMLSPRIGLDVPTLRDALDARERESSTAIGPALAIPHVVIEGEGKFEILLARCRDGIRFSDRATNVRAVFALIGTRDERNFHLCALAAFAQVARDVEFLDRWMAAGNAQALRDVVLLGNRDRS